MDNMNMKNMEGKKVLIVGLGKSGIAATQAMLRLGAQVSVQDAKSVEKIDGQLLTFFREKGVDFYLNSIPEDILESATIDGANTWKKVIYIMIPMIWESIKISVVMIITGVLKVFDMVFICMPSSCMESLISFKSITVNTFPCALFATLVMPFSVFSTILMVYFPLLRVRVALLTAV